MNKKEDLSQICNKCEAKCCKYVALEIDKPTSKRDYDNIRWYLLHKKVKVFQDWSKKWYIEFETECSELGDDFKCKYYDNRPMICREYGEIDAEADCEFMSDESPYKKIFREVADFEKWLDARKAKKRKKKKR